MNGEVDETGSKGTLGEEGVNKARISGEKGILLSLFLQGILRPFQ